MNANRRRDVTLPDDARLKTDRSLLEAALVGFGHQLGEVTLKIAEIKQMLGKGGGAGKQITGDRYTPRKR